MRVCRTCKNNKRITSFAKNSRSLGGRLTECKKCNVIYRIEHAKQRAETEKKRRRRLGIKPKKIYATTEERREGHLRAVRKWQKTNKQRVFKIQKDWIKRNPGYRTYLSTRRRLIEKRQTPKWADLKAIRNIYDLSRQFTEGTGVQHEVDHYYPLRGETVCGLHVVENLRILTVTEHKPKRNKHPQDYYSL